MTENHIGYSIFIADALPATTDDTGFEALSWTEVSGLIQGPQLGISHEMIDIPDLKSGFTSAVKGAASGTDTTMQFRDVTSDTGQGTLKTQAEDNDGVLSVKLVRGTGTDNAPAEGDKVIYAQGVAHSYVPNQPTTTSYEGFSAGFRQNALAVYATQPAA